MPTEWQPRGMREAVARVARDQRVVRVSPIDATAPPTQRLLTVEQVREQLGHRYISSTHSWLARQRIRLVAGRILESSFFSVWRDQPRRWDPAEVRKAVR